MKDGFLSASDFRQTETCSDCIERDDVDLLGRVRRGREGRVADCAGCGKDSGKRKGTGRQRSQKVDIVSWWVSSGVRES